MCSRVTYAMVLGLVLLPVFVVLADFRAITAPFTQFDYELQNKKPNTASTYSSEEAKTPFLRLAIPGRFYALEQENSDICIGYSQYRIKAMPKFILYNEDLQQAPFRPLNILYDCLV